MGLDAVELILRTEDEFGITIADDEAETASTVGRLYEIILSKLDLTPGCLTSKAFYLTRRVLVQTLDLPRRSIRPATLLSPLLTDETRQEQWSHICDCIGLSTPPLRIPASTKQRLYMSAFFASSAIAVVICITALWGGLWALPAFLLSAVFWIVLSIASMTLVLRLSAPKLATELPADTAGELARVVLGLNHDHFASSESNSNPTDEDIWRRLVDIICDQLQVASDEVVPNARFVEDLGIE